MLVIVFKKKSIDCSLMPWVFHTNALSELSSLEKSAIAVEQWSIEFCQQEIYFPWGLRSYFELFSLGLERGAKLFLNGLPLGQFCT